MIQLSFFKNKGNNSTVQVYFQKKNSTNHIREVAHSNLKHLAPSYLKKNNKEQLLFDNEISTHLLNDIYK